MSSCDDKGAMWMNVLIYIISSQNLEQLAERLYFNEVDNGKVIECNSDHIGVNPAACSSWRDINCNKVGFGARRRDRKPIPCLRGITDWIRDFQLFA